MRSVTFISVLMLLAISVVSSNILKGQNSSTNSPELHPDAILPVDPHIIKGQFDNGLTYYIRENSKPENRAQIWLGVNAGSILEDDDQLGLAHFIEHMAFNGTENFKKHEIINYLESIGMKFGPEINAYTGFDETVYMLQLPTDSTEVMEKGFMILREWAQNVSFDPEEVEKERGVVVEEWRLGRGAQMRMLDQQFPIIFKDSRYADRLPIGKKEVIENFEQSTMTRFYRDWYRPDLMAVVAVGDFDSDQILSLIESQFADIPAPTNPRPREEFIVPDHVETLFALATDPEATGTILSVFYKNEVLPENSVNDYRRMLTEQIFSRMLNIRLYELLNQAEPPYLYASVLKYNMVRQKTMYTLNVAVPEDGIEKGLETVLTEASRVRKFGFTQSELDRTKTWITRRMEQSYQERDKTESSSFASEYLRNYFEDEPIPGIEFEYTVTRELVPGIGLEEINAMTDQWLRNYNRVVVLNAPEKEGLEIPDESTLLSYFASVEQKEIQPYVDAVSAEPLIEDLPVTAEITSERYLEQLDITELKISNGIKVILKPTDFKNDEIQFQGFSPGGNSLVDDENYRSARAATEIVSLSGVGEFDLNSLNKKLTGKVVTVFPYIEELSEGIIGNASPRDLETLFQLIYLYVTRPRKDSAAYLSYKTRMQGFIENRFSSPDAAFYDTIQVTLGNYHYRERPWSMEMLEEIDPSASHEIYLDRFADAGDFTFVFVGSFDLDTIRPLITKYLGSLPSAGRVETWEDIGVSAPEDIVNKTVVRGMEPKSRVNIVLNGKHDWSRDNNYMLSSMVSVLRIKLRETLREDLSGTYGTSVSSATSLYPKETYRITISFGCSPDKVDELSNTVFTVIDSLKTFEVDLDYITKVRETQRRTFETRLKQNRFWLSNLVAYETRKQDPELILEYPEMIQLLDQEIIREAANLWLNTDRYVQVVLKPETEEP